MKKREKKKPMTETSLTHTTPLHIPPLPHPTHTTFHKTSRRVKAKPIHHHHRIPSLPKNPRPKSQIPKIPAPSTKKYITQDHSCHSPHSLFLSSLFPPKKKTDKDRWNERCGFKLRRWGNEWDERGSERMRRA